jgi:hypothetical protein
MFSKKEIRENILGCIEVMVFMKGSVDRFSPKKIDAIKSFIIPIVLIPIALFAFSFKSTGFSLLVLMTLHAARMIVAMVLSYAVVYIFCRQYKREEHFFQFITASNWMNIPIMVMLVPILFSLTMHAFGSIAFDSYAQIVKDYESYAVFITCLAYVYTAYIMTHALRIPWEMAGAITIVGLGIDQTMMQITEMAQAYLATA